MTKLMLLLSLLCMLFAGTAGLSVWRMLPAGLRALTAMCMLSLAVTIAGMNIRPNHLLFNLYLLPETALLLFAATAYLQQHRKQYILTGFFALFLLVYGANIYACGWTHFASYAMSVKCLVVTVAYLMVLFQLVISGAGRNQYCAYMVCLALLLYHACSVPVWGMFSYLVSRLPGVAVQLFPIIRVLSMIQYFIIGLCFISYRNNNCKDAAGS